MISVQIKDADKIAKICVPGVKAVLELREKDSNLHFLIQSQTSCPLDDPAINSPHQYDLELREEGSNLHFLIQSQASCR